MTRTPTHTHEEGRCRLGRSSWWSEMVSSQALRIHTHNTHILGVAVSAGPEALVNDAVHGFVCSAGPTGSVRGRLWRLSVRACHHSTTVVGDRILQVPLRGACGSFVRLQHTLAQRSNAATVRAFPRRGIQRGTRSAPQLIIMLAPAAVRPYKGSRHHASGVSYNGCGGGATAWRRISAGVARRIVACNGHLIQGILERSKTADNNS